MISEIEQQKSKKIIPNENLFFATLISLIFLDSLSYTLPVAFYPEIARIHGINSSIVGIVLGVFNIGQLLGTFLTKYIIKFYNKKDIILILLVSSNTLKILFGFTQIIENETGFIVLSIMSRAVLGICSGIYLPIIFSIVTELWPESLVRRISLLEMTLVIAFALGPAIGSFLYYLGGFLFVFLFMSIFTFLIGFFMTQKYIIKEMLSKKDENSPTLNYIDVFSNLNITLNYFYEAVLSASFLFFLPSFELHILSLGGTPIITALLFSLNIIGYICSIIFVNYIYKKNDELKFITAGSLINFFFLIFLGPDKIFGIEDNDYKLIVIGVALMLIGIGEGLYLIMMAPLFISVLNQQFPKKEALCNDMASILFASSFSLGEAFGPIIGGTVIQNYGIYVSARYITIFGLLSFSLYLGYLKWRTTKYVIMKEEEEL